MSDTAEQLLMEFLHQKKRILERAKVARMPASNWGRAVSMWGEHMRKMALIVDALDISPEVAMQAAFEQAFRNKHPDGPQMTMLTSEKYIVNALSMYLNVPALAIRQRRGSDSMLRAIDEEYLEVKFPEQLLEFTSEDVCFRYVTARLRNNDAVAAHLAPMVLDRLQDDRRMERWMNHRGYPYIDIAKHFHDTLMDSKLHHV